jgi:DNA invertase Pin-like site-specific DNA recombinase
LDYRTLDREGLELNQTFPVVRKTTSRSGPRIYGYARVSTLDQDLTIQHAALEAAGCMRIFEEKKSGTRRDGRTELQVLLECVSEGDTVIVTRIDRLARSMKDLQDIVHELKEKGVSLKATELLLQRNRGWPIRNRAV